jgi:catechol 2,3-dioxygenase
VTQPGSVTLGRGTTPLIVLEHAPALAPPAGGAAGLFHTAILFASQASLAASVYSVAT